MKRCMFLNDHPPLGTGATRSPAAGTQVVWVSEGASSLASPQKNMHGASPCWTTRFAGRRLVRAKKNSERRTAVRKVSSALGDTRMFRGTWVLAYLSRGVHLSTRSLGGLNIALECTEACQENSLLSPLRLYANDQSAALIRQ